MNEITPKTEQSFVELSQTIASLLAKTCKNKLLSVYSLTLMQAAELAAEIANHPKNPPTTERKTVNENHFISLCRLALAGSKMAHFLQEKEHNALIQAEARFWQREIVKMKSFFQQ